MEIPSVMYGVYSDVKKECSKAVSKLYKGVSWLDAVWEKGSTETAEVPGLFVMDGPSPLLGGEAHYHCYLLWQLVRKGILDGRLAPEIAEHVVDESIGTQWGTLGLLCHANVMWIYPRHRYKPLLMATLKYWEVFDAQGERYTNGSRNGARIWTINSNLKYILSNMGIDDSVLNAPLPEGGLHSILA